MLLPHDLSPSRSPLPHRLLSSKSLGQVLLSGCLGPAAVLPELVAAQPPVLLCKMHLLMLLVLETDIRLLHEGVVSAAAAAPAWCC